MRSRSFMSDTSEMVEAGAGGGGYVPDVNILQQSQFALGMTDVGKGLTLLFTLNDNLLNRPTGDEP